MKTRMFYVSEENLIEAIRILYPKNIKPKDYEYPISIYVKRIFERYYKKPFRITFELDSKHQRADRSLQLTAEETVGILRTHLEEKTPVDFGLAPITKTGNFEGYDYPFQIKRFIGHSHKTFLDDLIKFVERKSAHYRSPKTSLVVIPELKSSDKNLKDSGLKTNIINFSEKLFRTVANRVRVNKKSLRSILILAINDGGYKLTQVWPNYGEYKQVSSPKS